MPVIWELDFYSRPVLDEQQKKLWEVLICESPLAITAPQEPIFQYSRFCTNTEVNSVWLKQSLEEAIAQAPKPPDKIRYFRRQMANMITRGCEEAGIPVYPSRRTLALHQWIQQRMQEVYPNLPNYQPAGTPPVNVAIAPPKPLPDALQGQQWALVTLEAQAFMEMPEWQIDFSEAFPLEMTGVTPDTQIPGILIFSSRALPLAAWIAGFDLACLKVSLEAPAQLVLETGASDSWVMATLTNPQLQQEAQRFEGAKQLANQVHFLAVQSSPQAESFAGFWLMQELNLA